MRTVVNGPETTQTGAVEDYLAANPGQHRARDVARAVGLTNHAAAVCLYHLERTDRVERERRHEEGGLPYSLWSHPDHNTDERKVQA